MKKCNSCNIEFNTNDKYCPLCQNILVGESKEILFSKNVRYKTNSTILKILLFASIDLILLSVFAELFFTKTLNISLYVVLGLITNFVVVRFILKNFSNIFRMFGKYGLTVIILLLIWYLVTKNKLITNYIIPSICMFELLFNFIVGIVLRRNYLIKYSSQIVMNIFLLLLPLILVLLKQTTNNIMSYICCLASIISVIGLLIFFYHDIKEELSKIFNI